MNRKAKIIISILSTILFLIIGFATMWFDDEIARWYDRNIGQKFEESTQSPNVIIYEDMATISAFNEKRTLRIYTPPSYKTSDKRYPVIYMFDAHRLFDQKTTSRMEEGVDEILDAAIPKGGREIIIVAIDASENRNIEMNPYDWRNAEVNKADQFMDFIVKELKPMIDQKFRTLPDRQNTGIMGASLGGLMAFYTTMHHPDVFSKVGALSPSLLHSEKVFDLVEKLKNRDIQIYMNAGEREFSGLLTVYHLMVRHLKAAGFTENQLKTKLVADGYHEPKVWRNGFEAAYPWFFGEE